MRNEMAFGRMPNNRWSTADTNQDRVRASDTIQSRRSSTDVHDTEGSTANTMSQGLQKQPTHSKSSHGKTQSMPKHGSRGNASTNTKDITGFQTDSITVPKRSKRDARKVIGISNRGHDGKESTANTISTRTQVQAEGEQSSKQMSGSKSKTYWETFPTQSPVCRRNDGVPNRVDRLKSLGNAVVPQCAEWVGQQIIKSNILGERYVRN